MKTLIVTAAILLVAMALAACRSDGPDAPIPAATPTTAVIPMATQAPPPTLRPPPVETNTSASTAAQLAATETPANRATPSVQTNTPIATPAPLSLAPVAYDGPTSLEERVFASPVIARVRLDSTASTVESATVFDGSTKYIPLLEFSFNVQEYLKGSGANDIVAVWESSPIFDTQQEAEDALPAIAAARDAQWDSREGIVFLQNSQTYLTSTHEADRYYLTWQHENDFDDKYSIASRHNKLWLPAASAGASSQPTWDQQRFLTDVPTSEESAPTIALGEIKTRIGAVTAKLSASDGSEEYTECVQLTYRYEREESHYKATYPSRSGSTTVDDPPPAHELNTGLAAGTTLYEDDMGFGQSADELVRFWLDGGDANLFGVEYGDSVPYDFSGDGVDYSVNFNRRVVSARPLPEGVYRFHFNIRSPFFKLCDGNTTRYEWTVTANAPTGTLHEAFFDPVAVGTAVGADATNGVLSPTSFTVGGAATEMAGLEWENNQVVLTLSPHASLFGYALEFIELDGSVSLSLVVDDAEVDEGVGAYSWAVESQPWEEGDILMLRIREAS